MAAVVTCGMRSRLGGRAGVLVDALFGARRFFIPLLLELRSSLNTTKPCPRWALQAPAGALGLPADAAHAARLVTTEGSTTDHSGSETHDDLCSTTSETYHNCCSRCADSLGAGACCVFADVFARVGGDQGQADRDRALLGACVSSSSVTARSLPWSSTRRRAELRAARRWHRS